MSLERALLPICGISVLAMLLFVAVTMEIFTGNAHKSVSQSTLVRLGCNYSSAKRPRQILAVNQFNGRHWYYTRTHSTHA